MRIWHFLKIDVFLKKECDWRHMIDEKRHIFKKGCHWRDKLVFNDYLTAIL